ncbi:hypothetical protein RM844_09810 [Streptomyces sp. DSM 44915]|uniref:Uncharacterized protein n=1 Tax=Streptomyces chisholmiae TaxID=3075540 RepID=A0ABU2JQU7_9ACTN|nr:hypothetical protein [Streptomyces sp. DSM 44915]MDT0266588.1 hypothetical protein [Streptomyces sp. DSM 44915]
MTDDAPPSRWRAADYARPITLVCVAGPDDAERLYRPWLRVPWLNLDLRVLPAPEGADAGERLAADLAREVADRPYALLARGAAVATLLRAAPRLATPRPVLGFFFLATAPPAGAELPGEPWVKAMAGADDRAAPPAAVAGWHRLTSRLSLQVFEGGGEFLTERSTEVLECVHLDLGAIPSYLPGRGFADITTEAT